MQRRSRPWVRQKSRTARSTSRREVERAGSSLEAQTIVRGLPAMWIGGA